MPKEVMRRTAADNPYLHKDFHGAMSTGIAYLHERYGEEAVRKYLRQFVEAYHAPLKEAIRRRGLAALQEYLERTYGIEGGDIEIACSEDELVLKVAACPAVTHMREHGYPVADLWVETDGTVNKQLCEGTAFAFELLEYDSETGRSVQRFYRRAS